MRYRISNIPLWLDEDESLLTRRAAERRGLSPAHFRDALVVRRALDARKKGHARWLVNLEVSIEGELRGAPADVALVPAPESAPTRVRAPEVPPIILGAGPAGLFCAWTLLERGVASIVVDRGRPV